MNNQSYASLSKSELDQIKNLEESMDNKYILIAYQKSEE